MKLYGIDISEHNGNVNMQKIKDSGVKFVMIRASWGHFSKDKQLENNIRKCLEVGMPYGLYHYSYARNDVEARIEATRFLQLAKECKGRSYPLVLDMEDADGWKRAHDVSMQQEASTVKVFKEVIEGAGQYLMLYCSKSWYDQLVKIDARTIKSLDLWLAHWGISAPSVPCGMWQYSSDGRVNGSSARTDVNYAYKDYPNIIMGKKPQEHYYKAFDNVSIVEGLNSINVCSDYKFREDIAKVNGIKGYTGTAEQNTYLCDLARKGKLKKV